MGLLENYRYNVRNYAINYGLLSCSYTMVWSGLAIVLSSIEKRYSLSSSQSGFMFSTVEIGRIPMLLIVSHFGNRLNIPRLVALASVGIAIAQLIMVLPHFLITPEVTGMSTGYSNDVLCLENISVTTSAPNVTASPEHFGDNMKAYIVIVFGMFLMGVMASPNSNLAITYIDNNSDSKMAPIYLGIIGVSWSVGPVVGTLFGAYYISLYVDLTDTTLKPEDPEWVGAWWLMILTCSISVFVTAPFMACFPREIKNHRGIRELSSKSRVSKGASDTDKKHLYESVEMKDKKLKQDSIIQKQQTYSAKELPRALLRILKNPVFLTIVGFIGTRDCGGFGYRTYQVKYIETQFYVTAWSATIYAGMSNIVSITSNIACSVVIKKMKLTYLGVIKMILIIVSAVITVNVAMMFVGCESSQLTSDISDNGKSLSLPACSSECACTQRVYTPVCDVTRNLTYFSPCHAGCPVAANDTQILGCSCANVNATLEAGSCTKCPLSKIIIFSVFNYIESFCFNFSTTAFLLIIMRCVKKDDKGLAMGTAVLIMSLTAWMPSALIYGRVIDTTCTVWQMVGDTRGACWIYDLDRLRLSVFGLNVGLHSLAFCFMLATWFFANRANLTWETCEEKQTRRLSEI